jgi:predicted dehydrogenase
VSQTSTLQIALVGIGAMGSLHARVVSQHPATRLALVVDPREDAGRQVAERWGSRWQPDLDGLEGIDAVIIASPTATHHAWATQVLAAGKPLLVEKPISDDLAQTRAVLAEAERRGVPLMCGFLERYNPAVMAAMDILEAPAHITAVRHSPYVPRIQTGVAYDLLIHDVDLVLRIAGSEPRSTRGSLGFAHPKSQPGAEDVAEVNLVFPNGLLAAASASRIAQRKVRSMTIAEVERMVEIDLLRQDVTVYYHVENELIDDGNRGYRQQTIIDIPVVQRTQEPLARQLDIFVDHIRGAVDPAVELGTLLAPHEIIAEVCATAEGANALGQPAGGAA